MAKERGDVVQGTLDMLVLRTLQHEAMHGWGITERLEQWSEHVLRLGQGTLYPARCTGSSDRGSSSRRGG